MNTRRNCGALKKGLEFAGYAAGAVGITFAVIIAFVTIPAWVPVVTAFGAAVALGAVGYEIGTKEFDDHEATIRRVNEQNVQLTKTIHDMKVELDRVAALEYKIHYHPSPRGKGAAANSSGSEANSKSGSKSDSKNSPHTPPTPPSPRRQATLFAAQPGRNSPDAPAAAANDSRVQTPAVSDIKLDIPGLRIAPL